MYFVCDQFDISCMYFLYQHGSICQDWWISEGMGMMNLYKDTAVTSVSILL